MAPTQRLTRSVFLQRFSLPDWRVLNHSLVADFVTAGFPAASKFVGLVTEAAEAAQHHPDIDIRYPGKVRVTLTTHASNGLTELDATLASTISELAAQAGITATIAKVAVLEIAIDALDFANVIPFWKAVLGYIEQRPANPGDPIDALVDPLRIGPPIWFQQMDTPRRQRNRVHFDLLLPHDLAEERIAAAVAAGGQLLSAAQAPSFWVLADPEGNEVCICTWQDRD